MDWGQTCVVWKNAQDAIDALAPEALSSFVALSLDHDLYTADGSDAGDGLQVARHLSSMLPASPVIIHTSNADQGRRMRGELQMAGWVTVNSAAIGDDWIESDWAKVIASLIV